MEKKKCFVIMPFSETSAKHTETYWDNFFEVIKDEIETHNFICNRSETGPYSLIKQVIEEIHESDLVIAVLTDMNPNVWYELGIRHSFKNGTLMLFEDTQKIPFDISSYGLVKYSDGISSLSKLKKEIKSYVKKLNERSIDSPVLDTLESSLRKKDKIDEMYELVLKLSNETSEKLPNMPVSKIKNNRALWVGDYPSNNKQIIDLLKSLQVQLDIAINIQQGFELLNENDYNLIITNMGIGSEADAGTKLIKLIKEIPSKNSIPIIVFASNSAIESYCKSAIELGATTTISGVGPNISFIANSL